MGSSEFKSGDVIGGRYRVERLLGRGAWGAVYLAVHEALNRRVAVKVLAVASDDDPEIAKRFVREGRAALSVDHPGVPLVLDLGTTVQGVPFLVMEYLEGVTLSEFNAQHPRVSPAIASAILVPLLEVLEAAHRAGIIHRDLKPSNVMLVTGKKPAVKLLDFGISKLLGEHLTRTGIPMGTPTYMAPELARDGKSALPESDLYSVGVMLFELLTGRPPFVATNVFEMMTKAVNEPPPLVSTLRPTIDPVIEVLVGDLLRKEPGARPRAAAEVRARLLRAAPPDFSALWATALGLEAGPVSDVPVEQRSTFPSHPNGLATPASGSALPESKVAPRTRSWPTSMALGAAILSIGLAGGWLGTRAGSERVVNETVPIPRPSPRPAPVAPAPRAPEPPPSEQARNRQLVADALGAIDRGQLEAAEQAMVQCKVGALPCPEGDAARARLLKELGFQELLDRAETAAGGGQLDLADQLLTAAEPTTSLASRLRALTQTVNEARAMAAASRAKSRVRRPAGQAPKSPGIALGSVIFTVRPSASVRCGDFHLGDTPFGEKQLPVGTYQCQLTNPDRGMKTVKVEIHENELTTVLVSF